MMLRVHVNLEIANWFAFKQSLNIRIDHSLLMAHVCGYGTRIFVIQFHYETCQIVIFVERFCKFLAYERQLEVNIIGMARLKILQQRRHRQSRCIIKIAVTINCKVHHRKECICVYMLFLAHLTYCLITKTEADAEAAKALQKVVVVPDKRNHLVLGLIHFLLLHVCLIITCVSFLPKNYGCTIIVKQPCYTLYYMTCAK